MFVLSTFSLILFMTGGVLSVLTGNDKFNIRTTESSITLTWGGDDDLGSTVIEWKVYVDDDLKETIPGSRLKQDGRKELSSGLKAGESYSLQVKFVTESDDVYPVRNVDVVLDKDVTLNPKPVNNLQRNELGEPSKNNLVGSVLLTWEANADSVQDQFKVRYRGTYSEPREWSDYEYTRLTEMTLTGLVPGDRYQFQVSAMSGSKYSQPKTIEESIRPGYVDEFWIEDDESSSTSIALYVQAPQGIVRSWFLAYLPAHMECCWEHKYNFDMINDYEDDYHGTIYNLKAGFTYRIRIIAQGVHGTDSDDPNRGAATEIVYTTDPYINSSLELVEPPTETSVQLRYTSTRGFFEYYLIELLENGRECVNDDVDCPYKTKSKNDGHRVVVFNDLKPGTQYEAALMTLAEDKSSNSIKLPFKTAGISGDEPAQYSNLLPAVIVLAIVALLLTIAIVVICVISKRNTNKPKGDANPGGKNLEAGNNFDRKTKVQMSPVPNVRSVQPVPPLPRPDHLPSAPPRATSVDNEYLEILPDMHENCRNSKYTKPNKADIRDSGEYDKPYQQLQKATDTGNKRDEGQGIYDNEEEEKITYDSTEKNGEVNRVCEQC